MQGYSENEGNLQQPQWNDTDLSDEHKLKIINNRGRTQALGERFAVLFAIQRKNIEIGCITHIIHYVHKTELKMENLVMIVIMLNSYMS